MYSEKHIEMSRHINVVAENNLETSALNIANDLTSKGYTGIQAAAFIMAIVLKTLKK